MERHKAIFDYVLELQPDEREVFLRKISTEDPEVHREVLRLLDKSQADTQDVPSQPVPATSASKSYIFATGELIGERYRVIRAIARGGMGEVYEVADRELHSRVALKVINLKSAARPSAGEMFRREITLARQVTHPNVCRIYDLGHHDHPQHGDLLFLTMELLHGTTLSDYVRNSGTLTKEEALPLLEQMIHALAAAHKLNIAHRDFKSGNVILCGLTGSPEAAAAASTGSSGGSVRPSSGSPASPASGAAAKTPESSTSGPTVTQTSTPAASHDELKSAVVKVTDFGLARSLDGMETTVHNEIWGTPDYMAPEQFRGQSSIASDIYALGVVIYEMFTGKLPHRSSTSPVPPDGKPGSAMQNIPAEWRPVVRKCMAYEPGDRYATVDDVWSALRGERVGGEKTALLGGRALAAIAAVMIAVIGLTGWLERERIYRLFHPLPGPKHIAVLPFESIGGDADAKAFADGMGETLTSKLTQLERYHETFWVVPFSDSRKHHDVEDARRNLEVSMVITGATQRSKDSVRVTANLIDAKTHQQLASRIMTASVGDLDVLQDRVWQSVADMVDLQIDSQTRDAVNNGNTKEPSAYDFYVQGQGYMQHYTVESMDKAIAMFSKARSRDQHYALAYAGVADAYSNKFRLTKDPQWLAKADANVREATRLNEELPSVQLTRGKILKQTGHLEEALAAYRRAFSDDPNQVLVIYAMAELYEAQGKLQAAEDAYRLLIERHSSYWLGYSGLGSFYYRHGQFEKAARQFHIVTELSPDDPLGYQNLGAAYLSLARFPEAVNQLKSGLAKNDSPSVWNNLASAYIFLGDYPGAVEAALHATNAQSHNDIYWRNLGEAYHQIPGKASESTRAYERALQAARDRIRLNPEDSEALSGAALYLAHLNQKKEAVQYLNQSRKFAPDDSDVLFTSALVYEIIGHREKALATLDKAVKAGYSMNYVERDPELSAVRTDQRYKDWVKTNPQSQIVAN